MPELSFMGKLLLITSSLWLLLQHWFNEMKLNEINRLNYEPLAMS